MFDTVFVEKNLADTPRTLEILKRAKFNRVESITSYEDVFGKVNKPYLHKHSKLNLFIAEKKGKRVKPTPDAYGFESQLPHYFFYHQLNCIYDCHYCYLQGYFDSPDIVVFTNHEDIIDEMSETLKRHPDAEKVWFHAGEFSDSLALQTFSSEWELYWDFCEANPRAILELRTKASFARCLESLPVHKNIILSFSVSTDAQSKQMEPSLPSPEARIRTAMKLAKKGYPIGFHIDPIVYTENFAEEFETLANSIGQLNREGELRYISLGVIRFTKDVYKHFQKNYPDIKGHIGLINRSHDGKIRYSKPLRQNIIHTARSLLEKNGVASEKIYHCMEN